MVSDGMSPGVLTLAESYSQLTRKKGTQWWSLLNDRQATRGLMDTASANSMVTDSAAASSAWGGGQRVNNGSINIDPAGQAVTPIAEILKKKDLRIGLVTTATVTHATPAGFAASVPKRNDENSIAPQYLDRVDVVLGGGSGFFDKKDRPDKRDLSGDFAKAGYGIVHNRDGLLAAREEKLLGTFTRGHLPFSIDRNHNPEMAAKVPTISEMAQAALTRFLSSDKPFLLQIEGARIDHAAHLNDIGALLHDQLAFDDAVAAVLALIGTRDDILLVVTSDHGNSNPGLNGMGKGYDESTQRFAKIVNFKASHERLLGEWGKMNGRSAEQVTELVRTHLDFTLKPEQAEALFRNRPETPGHRVERTARETGRIAWAIRRKPHRHRLDRHHAHLGSHAGFRVGSAVGPVCRDGEEFRCVRGSDGNARVTVIIGRRQISRTPPSSRAS